MNVYLIYGPIGSGKSTLIRLLNSAHGEDLVVLRNDAELRDAIKSVNTNFAVECTSEEQAEKLYDVICFLYPDAMVHIIKTKALYVGNQVGTTPA